jgi:hypothetical protein
MQGLMRAFGGAKQPKNNAAVLKKNEVWEFGALLRQGYSLAREGNKHPWITSNSSKHDVGRLNLIGLKNENPLYLCDSE